MDLTEKYNTSFEQIEVITSFKKGKCKIHKFLWSNTVYEVKKMGITWRVPEGDKDTIHYTVTAKNEMSFELKFDKTNMRWYLIKWDYAST